MENARKGYAPWKDAKAFNYIKLETDAERLEREKSEAEAKKAVASAKKALLKVENQCAYCKMYMMECREELEKDMDAKNTALKQAECQYKIYGTDRKINLWKVVDDQQCGFKLKKSTDEASLYSLSDLECQKQDPMEGHKSCKYKDGDDGDKVIEHGMFAECEFPDGKVGQRLCSNGTFGTCSVATASTTTTTTTDETLTQDDRDAIAKIVKDMLDGQK
jgi:hypothetical protein